MTVRSAASSWWDYWYHRYCSHSAYARDRRRHRGQLIRGFTKEKIKGKKARESDHGPWFVGHAILLSAITLPPFSRPHRSSAARLIPMAEYLVSLSEVKAAGDG